jgi:phospholipid/cholesterol/gamma-HCH transport system ATP-binding protein
VKVETLPYQMNEKATDQKEVVIKAEHLKKSFGNLVVLKDISFKLYKRENIAVLGTSGTGKSVLIKSIVGLNKPEEGILEVFGKNILDKEDEDDWELIRRKVAYLFQGGALYDSMTVKQNLEFPLKRQSIKMSKKETDSEVNEALENVGLLHTKNKMPSELSGGMKKRIALARTLILKPEIMLYDEPTTGLDPVTSKEISELILEMREKFNISSIIVTHDMPCAKMTSDRVFILKEGVIGAEGTYDELVNSSEAWVRAFFT